MTRIIPVFFTALFAASLFSVNTYAESTFPHGCEVSGYRFDGNTLVLNETGQQAFYVMQNRSSQQIEMEHVETRPDVFMSPKLESKLASLRWAAFASDVADTHFKCYTQQNGERLLVNCRDALDVCQYPRAKFALSNMGSYWVSTNKPKEQVIKDAVAKGIYLRW
jgi:hypothetical protein